jgi:hypothetical protein
MKRISAVYFLSVFLTVCSSSLIFPLYSQAHSSNQSRITAEFSSNSSLTMERSAEDQQNQEDREPPLFESILVYLIIFIPVIIVSVIVWIFCRVIKLTNEKE